MEVAATKRRPGERVLVHRFGPLAAIAAASLAVSLILRIAFLLRSVSDLDGGVLPVAGLFAIGLFYDLVQTSYALSVPALLLAVLPEAFFRSRAYRFVAWAAGVAVFSLLFFDAVSQWLFWTEFHSRYNFIAVDYLVYTREVMGNIRQSYPVRSILASIAAVSVLAVAVLRRPIARMGTAPLPFRRRLRWALPITALPLLCYFTVDDRLCHFSANACVNELAGNGLYELFAAYRSNELDYEQFYQKMPPEETLRRLRTLIRTREATFTDRGIERRIVHEGPEKRLNVAMICVESLSADYMGLFGGTKGITPELDALAARSLAFMNVYATGTRTVRGLEAITLSVPPTPGQSIVRRPRNEDLYSLGRVFDSKGYESKYLYGGYGYFDNMSYFFSHNGYRVVDRTALKPGEIDVETIWGVADENLFALGLREMDKTAAEGKPFFVHLMTTSNHRPFLFPSGRIDLPTGEREGAVKYTDYAIGRFIRDAQSKPWFRDTVFVIVADHCAATNGRVELPVSKYHIPILIHSPAHVAPGRNERLMSQIDLAPTLLGLLNFSYTSKFFGYDLFALEPGRERAFISTFQTLGYLTKDRLIQLDTRRRAATFAVTLTDGTSTRIADDPGLTRDAVAWYEFASHAFKAGEMH
ncbi:MAG TPA: sulfatase-like hydrolase/transferase [Planctomycetota bacterium]|nr:sulfatase-like hydrolase/transferase [Planctomycetota bacterium]